MKKIRVKFLNVNTSFNNEKDFNKRFSFLNKEIWFESTESTPDYYIISSDKGKIPETPKDAPSIFLIGEPVKFNPTDYHFCVSMLPIASINHLRLPNWVLRWYQLGIDPGSLLNIHEVTKKTVNSLFCNFVYTARGEFRDTFVRRLNAYIQVDCPGKRFRNMQRLQRLPAVVGANAKLRFLRNYRFTIAMERVSIPGYVSEKLPEAILTKTVPIFWGSHSQIDFNESRFINIVSDDPDGEEVVNVIKQIMELNKNKKSWLNMVNEPTFVNTPDYLNKDFLISSFKKWL